MKGPPTRVYAIARKLKNEQHNKVEDDVTMVLDYPDATVIIEASWDWPYNMDRVNVFGPKGSLLSRHDDLLLRGASRPETTPEGEPVTLNPLPREKSTPIAYFLDCITYSKPVEDAVSSSMCKLWRRSMLPANPFVPGRHRIYGKRI